MIRIAFRRCSMLSFLPIDRLSSNGALLHLRPVLLREVAVTDVCPACRQHVLPRLASLDSTLADDVMLHIVGRLLTLTSQDAGISDVLRTLPFVRTAAGARKAPSELHDPRCGTAAR